MSFKYYFERTLGWMLNNKIIVLLSLLSFCLFVSTLAIAGQRNRLSREIADLTSTPPTAATTIRQPETTTNGDPEPTTTVASVTEKETVTTTAQPEITTEANQPKPEGEDKSEEQSYRNEITNSKLLDILGYSV